MTFRTSEMTQVFLIAVACSGAGNGLSALTEGCAASCINYPHRKHLQLGDYKRPGWAPAK
jgi:hypothetical protein